MTKELSVQDIQDKIVRIPNRPPFMLDSDLAELYGTETKRINEAVNRNPDRFPEDFCFQLSNEEFANLKSQSATSSLNNDIEETFKFMDDKFGLKFQNSPSGHGGRRKLPRGFTRMGANMLCAVLNTQVAVDRSIQIMRAFSAFEQAVEEGINQYIKDLSGVVQENFKSINDRITKIESERPDEKLKDELLAAKDKIIAMYDARRNVGRRVTDEERARIIALWEKGVSKHKISELVGRPRSTVRDVLKMAGIRNLREVH